LLLNDHVFWEFQKVVERNDQFLKASGLFTQFIAQAHAQSAAVGIRRHAKADKDSISIMSFLCEVRDHPQTVSREHYMSLYEGKEGWHIQLGQRDFDRVAGEGSRHIPSRIAEEQIQAIRGAVDSVEHYVDRRIAHYDKRDLARPLPKFSELTDALKVLEEIVILYWRLLKGLSLTTMDPIIMDDWKDIFRFVWEPKSSMRQSAVGVKQ